MSDPLSIIASVVGLVTTSANIASIAKQLYDSGKDAPASIRRIGEEMDQLHLIFGQVQMLLEGHAQKKPSRSRLTMLPLHHLMTILTGCVLAYSSLNEKLRKVAGVGLGARVQWALWGEAEAGVVLVDLERHKSSLHMMLTIIQCNSMKEANQSIEETKKSLEEQLNSLHEAVEKISEKIAESHSEVAVQLRELISRRHDASDDTDDFSICQPAHVATSSTECSSSSTTSSSISHFNDIDSASIRSTSSSLSMRSVRSLIPSWGEELKNSRPYKRLWRHGVDPSSGSVFSKDSSATKGDTWSMLSDMSLGDLSISEISVLELPISLSDLYDPIPYQVQQSTRHKQVRRRVNWSSRGRLHRAIRDGNIFTFRTLLSLGADPNEAGADGPLLVYAARNSEAIVFCRLLLDRGVQVDTRDSSGRTPLSHCTNASICHLLLDQGAAIDATDSSGRTPLSHSTDVSICELLLDRGAAVDAADSSGRTALSHSTDASICELLLDRGAAVDAADSSGRTPLSHCTGHSVSQLLLDRGAQVNTRDSSGRTPLSHCAENGNVYYLCDSKRGAIIDSTDSSARTPLSYSAEKGYSTTSEHLLDRGARTDLPDINGHTPLWYAQRHGDKSYIYQKLLKASRSERANVP